MLPLSPDLSAVQVQSVKAFPAAKLIKALAAAIAFLAVWLLALNFTEQALTLRRLPQIAWSTGLLVLFVPLAALCAAVLPRWWYLSLAAAASLGYLIFFPTTLYSVLAVLLFAFGFWQTYNRTHFELINNIKFAPQHIIRRASRTLLLVFMLAVTVNIYATVAHELTVDPASFYRQIADQVTRGVLPIVEKQLTGFQRNETLDQFIVRGFAESQPMFASLPETMKTEQIAASRQRILEQLGINASGTEPLSDVAQKAIEAQLKDLVEPYSAFLPLVYGLAVFSLLRILSIFLDLLAKAWGYFLFWALRRTRFLKITTTQILAEHVEI
jgi:hypothetical protein